MESNISFTEINQHHKLPSLPSTTNSVPNGSSSNCVSNIISGQKKSKDKSRSTVILAYYVFSLSPSQVSNAQSTITTSPIDNKAKPLTLIKKYQTTSKTTAINVNNIPTSSAQSNYVSSNENELDESSIALLCLPDGYSTINELLQYSNAIGNKFHTFLITRQNGSRYYGSSLIVKASHSLGTTFHIHCIISEYPFVLKNLLIYFVRNQPDSTVIQRICNLRVPGKGKFIKILLPKSPNNCNDIINVKYGVNDQSFTNVSPINIDSRVRSITSVSNVSLIGSTNQVNDFYINTVDEVCIIYRSVGPLLDYPLRQLFCDVMSPQVFTKLLTAALLEYQLLLICNDYYKLMLISESLTSLLAPFSWQHAYVPILPSSLGLQYSTTLVNNAPTSYIIGLNQQQSQQIIACNSKQTQHQQQSHYASDSSHLMSPSLSVTHTSQVRFFCDENILEFIPAASEFESFCDPKHKTLDPPPFLQQLASEIDLILDSNIKIITTPSKLRPRSDLMNRVITASKQHELIDTEFNYLDDLKLNHLIRFTCSTLLQYSLLQDYQKFIVTDGEDKFINGEASSYRGGFKFDSVSFLSDQPDSLVPFMSKFLQTQMFASFIDEKCKKLPKSRLNPNQSVVNNLAVDSFISSVRRSSHITRNKISEITSSINALYDGAFEDATIVNLNELDISKSCSSPRRQRKVYNKLDCKNLQGNDLKDITLGFDGQMVSSKNISLEAKHSPTDDMPSALLSETNYRIVESLLRETTMKTKRILLEKMGSDETTHLGLHNSDQVGGNTLIASLCDLIERVWTHGLKAIDQSNLGPCSSFWSFINTHFVEDKSDVFTQKFHPNQISVSSVAINHELCDSPSRIRKVKHFLSNSTPASPMHRSLISGNATNMMASMSNSRCPYNIQNWPSKFQSSSSNHLPRLTTSLEYDFSSIASMVDIKTDHGKSRAFLRLCIEKKLLSSHLKTLTRNQHLLVKKYKNFAFLRSEDVLEQFLTHLLTLNAVDLLCFTNTFTTSTLTYRFLIYSSGPVNGSFVINGTLNDSPSFAIEGKEMSFIFKSKNLGLIKSLTLSTYNSKVFIDFILIRNEITGHLFKLTCNKWLGHDVDDGSVEKVLHAEHITDLAMINKLTDKTGQKTSSIGRHIRKGWSSTLDSISGGLNKWWTQ